MILEVQHETRFEYSEAAIESLTELRMEPVSDSHQSCHSYHLAVSPQAEPFRYIDGFGNRVHHFSLLMPHLVVRILSASVVETHPGPRDLAASTARLPLDRSKYPLEVLDFVQFRGSVRQTPLLEPVLASLRPKPGKPIAALALEVSQFIHERFEYARDATLATSPVDEVLRKAKGVCQDFAHLMIAVLRSFEVPTRYVSGYIHRPNKESQSHAWCEVWFPDLGWIGIDPTNDKVIDEDFVKVAIGRDFTDVPPNKGVCRTQGKESISVRVETRQLERLPSLSWQEKLPPLNVPLQSILVRTKREASAAEEAEQQQQQQQ
jgi:transglutaminase-like putative cysteine protease